MSHLRLNKFTRVISEQKKKLYKGSIYVKLVSIILYHWEISFQYWLKEPTPTEEWFYSTNSSNTHLGLIKFIKVTSEGKKALQRTDLSRTSVNNLVSLRNKFPMMVKRTNVYRRMIVFY